MDSFGLEGKTLRVDVNPYLSTALKEEVPIPRLSRGWWYVPFAVAALFAASPIAISIDSPLKSFDDDVRVATFASLYAMLGACIGSFATLYRCIRYKMESRKWQN